MRPPGLHVVEHRQARPGEVPVVLVHGAPDRSRNFAAVAALLDDLPLVSYDRRGYGRSLGVAPPASGVADHARDLLAVLDGRPGVVCGQAAGGVVALAAAAIAPEQVVALGVWEPPELSRSWWPDAAQVEQARCEAGRSDTDALGEELARALLGHDRWDGLAEGARRLLRAEGAAYRVEVEAQLAGGYELGAVDAPAVVGCGTASGGRQAEGARRLARVLGADLYEVEGADHHAPVSHPAGWAGLVRRALALAGEPRGAQRRRP